MDICKYDLLSLIMNQSLEEIPETPSETGDMLLSIRKLVDLSVIIRKLSIDKNVVDKTKMTETRNKLLDKSDKISDFLKSDSNRKVLLENVKHNLLRYPEIIKKLKGNEYYSEELESLKNIIISLDDFVI